MSNILKKDFDFVTEQESFNETALINYAIGALMSTGQYAFKAFSDDWPEWSERLRNDLLLFEQKANEFSSSKLFTLAGKGWERFSFWYQRKNDDKKTVLQHAIKMFYEALKIETSNEEAKIGLATLLIERVQVRDLDKALLILNEISKKNDEIQLLISKAKRWTGKIEFEPNFDYTNIQIIPLTFLREERKKCRALVSKLKNEEKNEELKKVLEHMYRCAIIHDIATYLILYCSNGDNSQLYNFGLKKLKTITNNIQKYSYLKNGELIQSDNSFLSYYDYKTFESVFGIAKNVISPVSLVSENTEGGWIWL
jgi:hypothetical protein